MKYKRKNNTGENMTEEIKQRIEQINRGEVPKGYKRTKVGIVPEEWECKTFDELFEFYGGLGIARDVLGDNGIPYLHYGDMHKSFFTKVDYKDYLKMPRYEKNIVGDESYLLKHGDLVFLDASEDLDGTSRCVVVYNSENKPFISGLHTFRAIAKDESIQLSFKQYITIPQKVRKQFMQLASGFKVYGVNGSTIKKISISYPKDKNEQQRIADILSKWDEAIVLQEKLIEKLEVQKKALMQRLLAPKEGWKKIRFKDIYKKAGEGGTPDTKIARYYRNGDIPFVKIEHLNNKYIDKIESFITEEGVCNSSAWVLPINSLLFSNGATIGELSINRIQVATKQGILGVVPNDGMDVEFLYYYFNTDNFKSKVHSITTKGTMPIVYLKDLDKLKLVIPKHDEQRYIASCISCFDENLMNNIYELQKLRQQQKALHQLLLTGIVRV